MDNTLTALTQAITDFVVHDPRNAVAVHGGMRMYEEPIVAVAPADDEWFSRFAEPGIIGSHYMPPEAWLPGAQSVICWVLPFTKALRDTNRAPGLPSEEWVSARIDGEAFNNSIRAMAIEFLKGRSADAIAPGIDKRYAFTGRVANWSERHAAFVAGLGTFGLHRALITQKGTTVRLGSVITTLKLEPTARPYTRFDEYCPFLTSQQAQALSGGKLKCGACIRRCPSNAINESGKDNETCGGFIDKEVLPLFAPRYGCAKCNIGVPCENRIPKL